MAADRSGARRSSAASRGRNPAGPEFTDAMSALRGFALSELESAVVFSAGLNRTLYSYATHFADFLPAGGRITFRCRRASM